MVYYLLTAYYIQCFRAYHYFNRTNDYSKLDSMLDFDTVMGIITSREVYDTVENIFEFTSFHTNT